MIIIIIVRIIINVIIIINDRISIWIITRKISHVQVDI